MWSTSSGITAMTIAHDSADHHLSLFDRLQAMSDGSRQPNLLLPGARFTLFAFAAIVAGAALAFVT
jgi:hypothetical protein